MALEVVILFNHEKLAGFPILWLLEPSYDSTIKYIELTFSEYPLSALWIVSTLIKNFEKYGNCKKKSIENFNTAHFGLLQCRGSQGRCMSLVITLTTASNGYTCSIETNK